MGQYKEIDIIDYIQIIVERKRTVLSFLLIGLVLGGILSYLYPIEYLAETYLEVGKYGFGIESFYPKMLINPFQIIKEINNGFYKIRGSVKVNYIEKTDLIRIESSSKDPKEAVNILNDINKLILERYNAEIEERKSALEENKKNLRSKADFLTQRGRETEVLEAEINRTEEQIQQFRSYKVVKEPAVFGERKITMSSGLFLGTVLGFFLGVFFVSIINWWGKNRKTPFNNGADNYSSSL